MAEEPVTTPRSFRDGAWQKKIDVAKQARKEGKAIRQGRPSAFSTKRTLRLAEGGR